MRARAAAWVVALAVLTPLTAGCLGGDDGEADDAAAADDTGPLGPRDTTMESMYVIATDHSLNVESTYKLRPSTFEFGVGDTVNITLSNAEGNMLEHTLVIDELGVRIGPVQPGEQASMEVVLDSAGTFAFYCDVGNHRQLGMEGTLTVA